MMIEEEMDSAKQTRVPLKCNDVGRLSHIFPDRPRLFNQQPSSYYHVECKASQIGHTLYLWIRQITRCGNLGCSYFLACGKVKDLTNELAKYPVRHPEGRRRQSTRGTLDILFLNRFIFLFNVGSTPLYQHLYSIRSNVFEPCLPPEMYRLCDRTAMPTFSSAENVFLGPQLWWEEKRSSGLHGVSDGIISKRYCHHWTSSV